MYVLCRPMYLCLFQTTSAPLRLTPRMIHMLNQHHSDSALVHSSLALNIDRFLFHVAYEAKNRKLLQLKFTCHAIKANKKRKFKLKLSNV